VSIAAVRFVNKTFVNFYVNLYVTLHNYVCLLCILYPDCKSESYCEYYHCVGYNIYIIINIIIIIVVVVGGVMFIYL